MTPIGILGLVLVGAVLILAIWIAGHVQRGFKQVTVAEYLRSTEQLREQAPYRLPHEAHPGTWTIAGMETFFDTHSGELVLTMLIPRDHNVDTSGRINLHLDAQDLRDLTALGATLQPGERS